MRSVVLFKSPRAGLANKLIIWAHALTFSEINELELYETDWAHIPLGTFIRKEKTKRIYFNLISSNKKLPFKHWFKNKIFTSNYNWDKYKKLLSDIRDSIGKEVPVTISTDGYKNEIPLFNTIKNIKYFYSGNDLVDMLVMSKSQILIPFPGSSFSYWASFIGSSNVITIK